MSGSEVVPAGLSIALVGMMGSGKSCVGALLAQRLGLPFRDSDSGIEAQEGMSIPDIFARFGEKEFRRMEREVLASFLEEGPHVLATGGGVFLDAGNRELLRSRSRTVWLDADLQTLWDRLRQDMGSRPLLQTPDPLWSLEELLEARRPAYAKADMRIFCGGGLSRQKVVKEIMDVLRQGDSCS